MTSGIISDKTGDEQSDPECLKYFNSSYLVYAGNENARIKVNKADKTYEVSNNTNWENIWNGEYKKYIAQMLAEKYEMRSQGEIIFYGASNFRLWSFMERDMEPYSVQNHRIGGCTDTDLIELADTLLYPFKPKAVFIQTGSNDYINGESLDEVFANKDKMFQEFRKELPDTAFIVMSGLPLLGRPEYWDLTVKVNEYLKEYCEKNENMYFVDATSAMLSDEGTPDMETSDGRYFNPSIYVSDGLHLNQEGHDLWTPFMKDKLKELGIE